MALDSPYTLAYFDTTMLMEIYIDGNLLGISALFTQAGHLIQFLSHILMQRQHKALAITWACQYFHIHLRYPIHHLP